MISYILYYEEMIFLRRGFRIIIPVCRLIGIILIAIATGILMGMLCQWWGGYVAVLLILIIGAMLIVR